MKRLILAFALACSTAFAADTPASDASIKELLQLADAPKMVDTMMEQIDQVMNGVIAQATAGQTVEAKEQAVIDKYQADMIALIREELTWEKLEPLYMRIYREALTQEEVDGMIAFYKTPAGQALIKKMPLIIEKSMAEMPAMLQSMMQKLQGINQQFMADIQAAKAAKAAPAAAPAN